MQLAVIDQGDEVALRPMTVLGVMVGLGIGVYIGSLLLAVALVAMTLGAAAIRAARSSMKDGMSRHALRRARFERRRRRERLLTESGVPRDALLELTVLADEIERQDPALAARFEIDDLLDRHVDLMLAHERCLRAMRMADRDQLARARAEHLNTPASRRRADVFERRIRCWDQAREQADHCADELATLADLVRLLAQRAACPDIVFDDDVLDRRLGELDEEESAMRQLSVGNG
jgi:hypothetical protein